MISLPAGPPRFTDPVVAGVPFFGELGGYGSASSAVAAWRTAFKSAQAFKIFFHKSIATFSQPRSRQDAFNYFRL
jgi:hypothetical protein